ncbi:hypothetical protein BC937DRAFT_90860 [Endogone sp. FLAS-F59071]|nr:hypothetical protein BC937DRAFT_90860 [Endogone sp. FLAS-F59071]|eukprot:RUS16735.1 hypothetical protein BC937DRAFT_90860 [Endogone sp. FLAS-F59071]
MYSRFTTKSFTDKAAWVDDIDISDRQTLANLLTGYGFQGAQLVQDAQENKDHVKERLIENNKKAVARGACGVPSFQVNGGDMLWGQDHLNVRYPGLAGWGSESTQNDQLQARI